MRHGSGAESVAERINSIIPRLKGGTLRFWGQWSGRPYDNIHRIVGCEANADVLRLHFDQQEILSVWSPQGATITEQEFKIMNAERVRWEWFPYGRSTTEGSRSFMDFRRGTADIQASTSIDCDSTELTLNVAQAAVEIV